MDTTKLKNFAQFARKALLEQVEGKLVLVLDPSSAARRESLKAVEELEKEIKLHGREQVVERVAYTWFNRFCALRYMDVNRYTRIGIVSPIEGQVQPEILAEAKMGHIDEEMVPRDRRGQILAILDGSAPSANPQSEAYQLLFVAACNHYHKLMPFMFEKIADYTELLIPDDLLSGNSILAYTREALLPANCSPEYTDESVEVIGWLYQFYISEKKDDVFAALKKGKKITPENIPAATQLFTPHWIVRYLVENSLGRLWMLNHPNSRLPEQMDYYIQPEEPETDFLRISSPEEIKICDPACGSGHMLTFAFDLLYAIYEEQGYQATGIPKRILTHNLYGIEIDQRAGALAAFALTMKAREKYRRFLQSGKVVQPNICVLENIQFNPEDLSAYMDKVGRDLFSGGLQGVVNQWEEADNFGSLIRPLVTDVSEVQELLRERQMGEDLFLAGVHQKVLKALRQADYLSPKYHVVVANPPYMGSRGMNATLKEYAYSKYEIARTDLFAMFVARNVELGLPSSIVAMITMQSWMFLSSLEGLREGILSENTIQSMVHFGAGAFDTIGGEVVSTTAFTLLNVAQKEAGTYVKLTHGADEAEKNDLLLQAIRDPNSPHRFRVAAQEFRRVPHSPLAYWATEAIRSAFEEGTPLEKIAPVRVGLQTGSNERFVREWFEVSSEKTSLANEGEHDFTKKWYPYNKGGEYRKWYGNHEHVVNWENDGYEIRNFTDDKGKLRSRPQNCDFYFRDSISWSFVSSSRFGVRFSDAKAAFDVGGSSAFPPAEQCQLLAGFLCSRLSHEFMKVMNPTLNFQVGNVAEIPVLDGVLELDDSVADRLIGLHRNDWDAQENAWGFERHPLLIQKSTSLPEMYGLIREGWKGDVTLACELEQQNNASVLEVYSATDQNDADFSSLEITLFCNPVYRYGSDKSESELEALLLADAMREFISYAVGCMLGRYSLDKPGLILANQGETADDYRQQIPEPRFPPDKDNVIPLLNGDWFTDDISERFKAFFKVTFGTEHYEENLTFLENGLYPENRTGKKRKTIRDYFLKDFYNHHIKLYKKRPIYWLFSSPKGTFNALIYMHRYREDTVSVVLNDYLREFQTKLTAKLDHLQSVADSGEASKTEKTKALKEITNLKKQLKELTDYERDILYPLASEQIEIDLDDGVKENYNKFGKALKKVTGLTSK